MSVDVGKVRAALAKPDEAVPGKLASELQAACSRGDAAAVTTLLQDGADARHQDGQTGVSAMMLAAEHGHAAVVLELLQSGAPWNAQDKGERSAGDHAVRAGQHEVRALLLRCCALHPVGALETAVLHMLPACAAGHCNMQAYNRAGTALCLAPCWPAPLCVAIALRYCQCTSPQSTCSIAVHTPLSSAWQCEVRPRCCGTAYAHPEQRHWPADGQSAAQLGVRGGAPPA